MCGACARKSAARVSGQRGHHAAADGVKHLSDRGARDPDVH
jgi:hypothetical protein